MNQTNSIAQKSILARLLAKENVEVIQGNYPTAFFDVENRVLGLPSFKEGISKDLLDLFVGHEVGHALHTPPEGWHESAKNFEDIPRAFINIIEDIRIEKKVLGEYPGLIGGFKRGYKELLDRNFFGIEGEDLSSLNFMDRVNLFSKSRGMLDISFTDEEMPYVNMAMNVNTFEDVLSSSRAIVDWLNSRKEEQEEMTDELPDLPENLPNPDLKTDGDGMQSPSPTGEGEEDEEGETGGNAAGNEGDKEEEEPENADNDSEESNSPTSSNSNSSDTDKSENESEKESSTADKGGKGESNSQLESKTDDAFRQNEKTLINDPSNGGTVVVTGMSRKEFDDLKVPFATLEQARQDALIRVTEAGGVGAMFPQAKYDSWMKEAKGQVTILAKEFEMRKAAYRSMRSRTSAKGTLDVTKLHKYKYDDQLFKQVTKLADSKSHGMIMFIDFSGSMSRVIDSVMKQTLILAMFCDRVNIPYQVYSFTDAGGYHQHKIRSQWATPEFQSRTRIETDMQLCELLSSSMSKADKQKAVKFMFNTWRHLRFQSTDYDNLRGTPLNLTFMAAHYVCADFQAKYNVQKLNVTFLTDGLSDQIYVRTGNDLKLGPKPISYGWSHAQKTIFDFYGNMLPINVRTRDLDDPLHAQNQLAKSLKDNFNCNLIHYFIADSSSVFRAEIFDAKKTWEQSLVTNARKAGAFIVDNHQGYNRRLILEARGEVIGWQETGDLEVDDSMSASQIATAFKKQANGKSKKRFICQKFAEMVA